MRNRALQVSVVKKDPNAQAVAPYLEPEQINEVVKHTAIAIGAVLLTKKAADTISELILITGRKYI